MPAKSNAKESTKDTTVELKILSRTGKAVGSRNVPAAIFAGAVPEHLLHQVVRWQRARWRAGTHSTQTRAEMTGGGVKPWRQKGTGRARAGSNTSPLWVGGGVAHGPKPRSYEFKLNKRERRRALAGVMSARNREGRLLVVDDFGIEKIRTKEAAKVLDAIGVPESEPTLVVVPTGSATLIKSLRNLDRVKVLEADGMNVYDILRAKYLVVVGDALTAIENRFTRH